MRSTNFKATLFDLLKAGVAASILLTASGVSFAQVVNLTAKATTAVLPDGQSVPMWGYSCTPPAAGAPANAATCATANPHAGANWSPVVITVPYGQPLTINLTNNLPGAVPTSLVIVGQLGGGLGTTATTMASPPHPTQTATTWPIATAATGASFTPPAQAPRVQSFATEVGTAKTTALTWNNLSPGTYLIESGTHPSIQGPMGLYGVLVVKIPVGGVVTCPVASQTYQAYPNICYDADVPLVLSEIDPLQNTAVAAAVTTPGFSETMAWSGQPGGCGDSKSASFGTCYPPTVNYDPRYYLINGVAFDRTNAGGSSFTASAPAATGRVLMRFVNAGLRMHVPSLVGAQTGNPAVSGISLIAEDGNVLPGNTRVQSEVFLAAGKTYDVMMNAPATGASALPVYDRELSLSTNNQRDGGMQAYISVNGGALPTAGAANQNAIANPDKYFLIAGNTLTVSDPAKGVIANDVGVYGVKVLAAPTGAGSTLTLNPNGTFTYVPGTGVLSDSFTYCGNGATSGPLCATVTLAQCTTGSGCLGGQPTAKNASFTSNIASHLQISPTGVLAYANDPSGLPLTAALVGSPTGGTVTLNADGSFTAAPTTAPAGASTATVIFKYKAVNSQNTASAPATVTVTFKGASLLAVTVKDPKNGVAINDYRWIIEEDRTFLIDPACQVNSTDPKVRPTTCPPLPVQSLGTNFHSSYMPVVASGCVGTVACESGQTVYDPGTNSHKPAVCDVGNGACRAITNPADAHQAPVDPSQVSLDPNKRYYISILPGDAGNTFASGAGAPVTDPGQTKARPFSIDKDCGPYGPTLSHWAPGGLPNQSVVLCGHTMGGAPIPAGSGPKAVTVAPQETPPQTAKIAVFVFEDDFPLNGENDAGGGADTALATQEPGLGGFQITLNDQAGAFGDATGQPTYDMFNMPLSNSLAGTKDPRTGWDACPIAKNPDGLVGMIVTCPHFESDGKTISPLEGQAVIANLYPGLYEVVATPAADRIARGEEWLQTNTLDGTKGHEAFIKAGEPAYFQEFGPAGYHVSIGFANPKIINARLPDVCASATAHCTNTVKGKVTMARISRSPDERIYSSGSYDAFRYTQCYVSLGDPDAEDFAFTKCNADGTFMFKGIPDGSWRITVFDQWNDLLVDGLSVPVAVSGGLVDMGDVPMQQWRTNLYTRTFMDNHGDGVSRSDDPGLGLVSTNVRYRDGSISNLNTTDLNGFASFNEIFPFFNWLTLEADTTRFKPTGTHVVYDAGGPADGHGGGSSTIASGLANTLETNHLPTNLRIPGAVYCDNADCTGFSIKNGPGSSAANPSTGRIDPPWVPNEAWQGFIGNAEFVEFGKKPFATGENGGIKGEVIYASTRPFDDPMLLLHTRWTPDVPNVTVNLYQKGTGPDGTPSLTLVDTTMTSSWDKWAQGFRSDGHGGFVSDGHGGFVPNMNCPGQDATSPFFFTLKGSTQWLNPGTTLANNSQFKCYDGMHAFNQVQPAPYDGMYHFPSIVDRDPVSGAPTGAGSVNGTPGSRPGSNCTICVANPDDGTPMLPAGKYVVEIVVPPGYELVKEEDKNILIGDNFIAPVTQQFGGLGAIFILPDQAAVNSAYNRNNAQNPTTNLGSTTFPRGEGDTGSVEQYWPCVGQTRVVPDYLSLFPGAQEVAPFAGASRPLCDRKEVTLADQVSVLAKFYIFSSTHVASHFTGIITNDFASEFDPFSPQFGEKFAIPNLPVSFKDFNGNEVARFYSDQWGFFNGLNYSTWEVNPPNPTGYAPTIMVTCMNDPGPVPDPLHAGQTMTDPLFNSNYSQFCYEWAFMPGTTAYMDTPVIPTAAFADSYTPPDCKYPDATPAIAQVIGNDSIGAVPGVSGKGPWVSGFGAGHTLTITARGDDKNVPNPAYSGPTATKAPFNQKFITRHYGFGAQQGSGSVTIGGVTAPVVPGSWSDTQITVIAPALLGAQSSCTIQQSGVLAPTMCGELVITAGNGKRSIDTVTVTIGGKPPTYVTPTSIVNSSGGPVTGGVSADNAIQVAIDKAASGDLIIVGPGTYNEMLLMWKPVRLQGVGAASVTVNASAHPSGKMDPWRRQVNCLFGLSLNGGFINTSTNPYDPNGAFSCSSTMQGKSDPIPLEPLVGWDPGLNGNLAELLQEPTLMGAYEGAAITVLGKGLKNANTPGVCDSLNANGCIQLNASTAAVPLGDCNKASPFFGSNFLCNPSRIDGMSFTNSSAGGGGVFLHGWNHSTEVSNNRIYGNSGTLSGGITVGQMETPDAIIGADGVTQMPFGYNRNVRVHHNSITQNSSIGDELNSVTPEAAGGVTMCTGSDTYRFNYNWVCGNMSGGDGGGFTHFGFSADGRIADNWFLFNQSFNPTIPTNGGGLSIMGAAPDGAICENITADQDCPPQLSDGIGPNLVIDSNLIVGNSAESGSGGGLRLQSVNGTEVARNPTTPAKWYGVTVTNNIIADNVAGWDGGGVSLQDALRVSFINNTVVSNDTTASSGVLFNTIGAANANTPPPAAGSGNGSSCKPQQDPSQPQDPSCVNPVKTSTPQAAGLVAMRHTSNLIASLPAAVTCPAGYPTATACREVSYPTLQNDLFWQNRTFNITVGPTGSGLLNQQNLVTLVPTLNQSSTGNCPGGANYWDIGIRGDTGPTNHNSGFTLQPVSSILTSFSGTTYNNNGNQAPSTPDFASQYCNGSRVPPENGGLGYNVAPGISDATLPNPVFNLTPAATVDEGNNWVNMAYGPLSLNNAAAYSSPGTPMPVLGNYSITTGSPAIDKGKAFGAPDHDIFGTRRPQGLGFDIGAVELRFLPGGAPIDPLALGSQSGGLFGLLPGLAPNLGGILPGGAPQLPATPPLNPAQVLPAVIR
ncbi:choice-of-anchor Q domain-containing protein [Paraburkholderia sp. GAS334]|uniref:choice-of-anchor Q domain-containing protein n=1 Tax=Paraburkholderia sp. GAS334 TaxID=3035131 RepID=UPI003D22E3D5